jgi:hypothetical protein
VWIKIFGLSQEYWHKNILFTIAGSIGTPICIDSVTAKPMHERTFGQFARVLVDLDLQQPLRYKLLVERKGFAFFVDLEYEHIPPFCTECKMIGHGLDNCKRRNMGELRATKENNNKLKSTETKKFFVPIHDGRDQQTNSNAIVNVEVINVEDNQPVLNNNNGNNNGVSIGSSTRDVGPSQVNEVPILSPVDPQVLLRLQDKQLEGELNDDSEDGWSTASRDSFVNNTQLVVNEGHEAARTTPVHNSNTAEAHQLSTPLHPIDGEANQLEEPNRLHDRVIRDMVFLKESWANMTEADEEVQQNVANSSPSEESTDTGFQIHLSKNQKKAQKKLKQSSKDSYATRSKVPPKPFR